jgi:arylsulfatase
MNRRDALKTMGALLAAPALLRGAGRRPGHKPNLLFLWTDEQRADTMAAYGNRGYHVPAMNRLASESIVFDRCYVTQPVCTPSRTSVMTGLWPHTAGTVRNNIPLKRETKTLPELLADSDYRTGYMGKWHLGDEVFAQHGFQEWRAIEDGIYNRYFSAGRDRSARSAYHQFLVQVGYKPDAENFFPRSFATKLPVEHTKPSFLANEATKFILKNRKEPWVLYVNTLEPHMPFSSVLNDLHSEEEAPLPENYPGIPEGGEPAWYKKRRERFTSQGKNEFDLATREGWQRLNRNYAGLCSLVDQGMARILWALEISGQAENTIIVYTSDHGEMRGAHTLMAKSVMYEEAVRVPLLLRVPFGGQKPQRVPQPVSHIDLAPTLLDLLGKKDCCGLPGRSLLPLVSGERRDNGDVFIEWNEDPEDQAGFNGRTIVSPEGWKLALYNGDSGLLFDRRRDPLELHNLYGRSEQAATARALRQKIEAWQRRAADKLSLPG